MLNVHVYAFHFTTHLAGRFIRLQKVGLGLCSHASYDHI